MAATITLKVGAGAEVSPESLLVNVATVTKRTQATGTMILTCLQDFDPAVDPFAYGDTVILKVNGVILFQGKVTRRPRTASGSSEGQTIEVQDAWDELERTTYQEVWLQQDGSVYLPRAVLGLDSGGLPLTTGQQISAASDYAASVGCTLATGTVDAGFALWPQEVLNVTCAEVIRTSMRFHPDWTLWIDHSPVTPTLNARAQSSLSDLSFIIGGDSSVASFVVDPVDNRVPTGIRIVYESLNSADGQTYRSTTIDQAGPATEGPGAINVTVQLAGMKTTTQSQPVETRDLPSDASEVKAWLKLKYPKLTGIADEHWTVIGFKRELVPDGTQPEPVNSNAPRVAVGDIDELPRELVRGNIADWMRVKVGKIQYTFEIIPQTGITTAERKLLPKGKKELVVNATDATTKVYRGIASWEAGENAPAGIASNMYNALSVTQFQGSVTLASEDVPTFAIIGRKINLTGGEAQWETMNALVNQVVYDIERGITQISFGPPRFLAPQDWLELKRSLRNRTPSWISGTSRASDNRASDGNEVTGGYDVPTSEALEHAEPDHPFKMIEGATGWSISQLGSTVWDEFTDAKLTITGLDTTGRTDTGHVFVQVDISTLGAGTASIVIDATEFPGEVEISSGEQSKANYYIGKVESDGDGGYAFTQATRSAATLTFGFLNGTPCRVFAFAPSDLT